MFLSASPARLQRAQSEDFQYLCGSIVLISAAWGLLSIWLWQLLLGLTWQRTLTWVVPAAVTAAAIGLIVYRQAILAVLDTPILGKRLPAWARLPGLLIVTAGVGFMLNFGVRYWDSDQINNLPASLQWLWPEPLYRIMFLSNLWGAWAILVLLPFHRRAGSAGLPVMSANGSACPATATTAEGGCATSQESPAANQECRAGTARRSANGVDDSAALAATAHPLWAGLFLIAPLALSLVYLAFLHPRHFIPPLAAVVSALGLGGLLVRLHGGLCRSALLAADFVTQCAFWLAYLAVMR